MLDNLRMEYQSRKEELEERLSRRMRKDEKGVASLPIGAVIAMIISAMVLVIVVAALWATFTSALTNYSTNETTFGPTVKQLTPILIGVGILLLFVAAFLGFAGLKKK